MEKTTDPEAMQKEIADLTKLVQTNREVHHQDALSWQKTVSEWQSAISQWKHVVSERDAVIVKCNAAIEMQNRALRSWKDSEMRAAIERAGGDPTLIMDYASKHTRVKETATAEGRGFRLAIVDDNDNTLVSDRAPHEWMSFDQYVQLILMVKYPSAFPPQ